MLCFYSMRFFVLILWNYNLATIQRVSNIHPEITLGALQALFFGHFVDLFGIKTPLCQCLKSPFHDAGLWFMRFNVFLSGFGGSVYITSWSNPQVSTFFFGPPHSVKCIQCAAVVLDFWRGQIKSQHHFIFRY
ncbi:hypothetical protein A4D02_23300 [Niastella koreensis]|uniref:Uncharacterized protein n=1 Tax=Niastella koreensis TaxID=354356 RepID=A0ABX3P054_9BACT|nr:hypothetical protein A4D02_23300 [Niastella koreensis]